MITRVSPRPAGSGSGRCGHSRYRAVMHSHALGRPTVMLKRRLPVHDNAGGPRSGRALSRRSGARAARSMAIGERPDQSFCALPWTIGHYAAAFTDYRHGNRRLQGHQPMIRISLWKVLALGMSTVMTL
jgi:hypothetical protein